MLRNLILLLSISTLWACKSPAQELMTTLQQKAERLMVKDSSVYQFFSIDPDGIRTYPSPEAKLADSAEFFLAYAEIPIFERLYRKLPRDSAFQHYAKKGIGHYSDSLLLDLPADRPAFEPGQDPEKPLQGLKVALDPGHLGGSMDMAELEKKYIKMKADPEAGIPQEIAFNEGNLALATAHILKQKLEKAGAEVLVTRQSKGLSAFGISFDQWYRQKKDSTLLAYIQAKELSPEDSTWWQNKATRRHIYRSPFLWSEFNRRADLIHHFEPHLTLIIHYNVEESNESDRAGWFKPQDQNYSMAFVPGSYMDGELGTPDKRFEFVARLINDDIERSIALSAQVTQHFVKELDVPLMEWSDSLRYLKNASLPTAVPAVFARNLSLCRLIPGVLCFGESLLQDNREECLRLARKDFQIAGVWAPERVKSVAEAYYQGVLDYLKIPKN